MSPPTNNAEQRWRVTGCPRTSSVPPWCGASRRRRSIGCCGGAGISANPFIQSFCAALLAGAVGAVVVDLQLSTMKRRVAVCPCMVLVPGPHLLNGAIDLARARIALGESLRSARRSAW
jgi:hypothetical protein